MRNALARGTSTLLALSLGFSSATPAIAGDALDVNPSRINRGTVNESAPNVDSICAAITNASSGNFVGKDGKAVTFTDSKCSNLTRRQRTEASCQISLDKILEGVSEGDKKAKIDALCLEGRGALAQEAAAYCAIRAAASDGQAARYCEAYNEAKNAKSGMAIVLGLDIAAAGLCWNEYRTLKKTLKEGSRVVPTQKGPCGKASMAAGLGEFVYAAKGVLGGTPTKIDTDGNIKDPSGKLTNVLGLALKAGLSGEAIRIGLCQTFSSKFDFICGKGRGKEKALVDKANQAAGVAVGDERTANYLRSQVVEKQGEIAQAGSELAQAEAGLANARTKLIDDTAKCAQSPCPVQLDIDNRSITSWENKVKLSKAALEARKAELASVKQTQIATNKVDDVDTNYSESLAKMKTATANATNAEAHARMQVAYSSGVIFTALTAMRVASISQAGSTANRAKDILQSMFSAETGGTTFGTSGLNSLGTNIYSTTGGATFNVSGGGNQPSQNKAVAAGSPEAYLLPPGSEHGNDMQAVANQIPREALEKAAEAGPSGVAGMISGIAGGGSGGELPGQIHQVVASAFANLPKEEGGYSGGGGKSLAKSGGENSPELNLKGLFGEAEKPEQAAAENELAYRTIASEDIWHTQNPNGHNLFQIVSDRYDTAQRKLGND